MTIKHLVYRIAHQFSGGVVGLADLMGKGHQTLINKVNPNSETHHLTIAELEMLADFTQSNKVLAEYFAAKVNAVVVPMPDCDGSDMALLDLFMKGMKEFGEVHSAFQRAYADGDISESDNAEFAREVDDALAALLMIKSAVKGLVR